MRIEASRQVAGQRFDNAPRDTARQGVVNQQAVQGDPPSEAMDNRAPHSQALVAITPAAAAMPAALAYRQAAFLAHLIATREQAPQTRERRRAEPGDAVAAYRATAALTRT